MLATVGQNYPKSDLRDIERAFGIAERWNAPRAASSDDHPLSRAISIAAMLADLGLESATVSAELLYQTIGATDYTLERVRADFGEDVVSLVDGGIKLDKVKYVDAASAESVRRIIIAMSGDLRILVMKLAERLHSLRVLRSFPQGNSVLAAHEALDVYAPLARQMLMRSVKDELEDHAFAIIDPTMYRHVLQLIEERWSSPGDDLQQMHQLISSELHKAKIKSEVTGRIKPVYSIYRKMIREGVDHSDIDDLIGVRVLVDTVRDCYAALGTVHAMWNPIPGRFKDYVAMPTFDFYQALFSTLVGPEQRPVEVQIRTHAMQTRNESISSDRNEPRLVHLLGTPNEASSDVGEFIKSLRFNLFGNEIFVLTPKGDVVSLPADATVVDFAYTVHTEVGNHFVAARVNGSLKEPDFAVKSGDVVEILTSRYETSVKVEWLEFARSRRARRQIRRNMKHG